MPQLEVPRIYLPRSDLHYLIVTPKKMERRWKRMEKVHIAFPNWWFETSPIQDAFLWFKKYFYFSGISLVYPVCHRMDPQSLGLTCSCWESTTCKCFLGDAVISGDVMWTTSDFHHFLVMSESKSNKKWGCNLPTLVIRPEFWIPSRWW